MADANKWLHSSEVEVGMDNCLQIIDLPGDNIAVICGERDWVMKRSDFIDSQYKFDTRVVRCYVCCPHPTKDWIKYKEELIEAGKLDMVIPSIYKLLGCFTIQDLVDDVTQKGRIVGISDKAYTTEEEDDRYYAALPQEVVCWGCVHSCPSQTDHMDGNCSWTRSEIEKGNIGMGIQYGSNGYPTVPCPSPPLSPSSSSPSVIELSAEDKEEEREFHNGDYPLDLPDTPLWVHHHHNAEFGQLGHE